MRIDKVLKNKGKYIIYLCNGKRLTLNENQFKLLMKGVNYDKGN